MYFWKWNQMTSCEKELIIYSQIYKDFVFVQSLSHVWLFVIPWGAALPASLSFTISRSLLKLMFIESAMPFKHLNLLSPSPPHQYFQATWSFPMIWLFTSGSPSNEYSGLISFRIDWFDLLAVQGGFKCLLQHHSSKASILQHSAFFMT